MFRLIELQKVEEEHTELMVELALICLLNVMLKCGLLRKLQM
jgi:hypothetical protein